MIMQFIKLRNRMTPPAGKKIDAISWDQFSEKTIIDLDNFPKPSDKGLCNFSILSPNNPERRTQNSPHGAGSWNGAFNGTMQEKVLYTCSAGPITILFDKPIRGAGANIDINQGVKFQATIMAFDGGSPVTIPGGGVRKDGQSNHDGQDTAIFIGFLDDDPLQPLSIRRIAFDIKLLDTDPSDDTSFAINQIIFIPA